MLPALLGLMAPVAAVRALTQLARAAGAALRSATARVALPVATNAEKAAEGFFDNSDSPVIFAYDGYGRRIKIAEFDNGNLTSKKLYWWLGGEIVCERDGITPGFPILKRYFGQGVQVGGTNLYYTFDQLGSVRELVDSTGAVRADYRYSTYGERTKEAGDLDSDWGYAGLFHHGPSGLDLATYRVYDSKMGRWISRDPLGEGVDYNLYRYCGNNPIGCNDPSGLIVVVVDKELQSVVDFLRQKSTAFRDAFDALDRDQCHTFYLRLGDLRYAYQPDSSTGYGKVVPFGHPGLTKIYRNDIDSKGRLKDGSYSIIVDRNQLGQGRWQNTTLNDVVAHEIGGHAIAALNNVNSGRYQAENGEPFLFQTEPFSQARERLILEQAGLPWHRQP